VRKRLSHPWTGQSVLTHSFQALDEDEFVGIHTEGSGSSAISRLRPAGVDKKMWLPVKLKNKANHSVLKLSIIGYDSSRPLPLQQKP
jgi:hypothetical protein